MRRTLAVLLPLVFAGMAFQAAVAQEGVTSYAPDYFAANQPTTAYDMVALLPGFQIRLGDSAVRGFSGTVGNVLIDGQLPTSKEIKIDDLLRRIAASSVLRIELIRGAADMHGYPVLANVVRSKTAALSGHAEVEGAITHYGTTTPKLALHLTRQGEGSTLDVSAVWWRDLGLQNSNGFGTRARYRPDGTPLQLSLYDFPKLTNIAEFGSSYRQSVWQGDFSVGLVLKQERAYSNVREQVYFPSSFVLTGLESARSRSGEGRVDYARDLGDLGQIQLFAVHRLEEQDEISQTTSAAGTDMARSRYNQREDVARLAWQYADDAWKLETGVEGSINVLSSRSTLLLGGAPVILPAANVRVEEKRVEFFSTATWRLNPVLMSEMGLRYETSTLTQSGDSSLVKDLAFLKPRWLTTWNPAPGHELRLLLERQVGQLVFRDFASSTSLNSNIVTGGNKNLEPASSWNISLAWERHFWDRGSLVLEAKREYISDVVDKVPVFAGGQVFNAVGNIGDGTRNTLQTNLILPLDAVGLDGVTVKGEGVWRHSRVRDPATGLYRKVVGGQTFGGPAFVFATTAELTYDMPERNLQLGMTMHSHADSVETEYRIDEISNSHHDIKLGIYAEYKPTPVWTIRAFGRDVAQTAAYRDRDVYAGLRGSAPLRFIEHRSLNNGALMGVNVQHDF
jgi:outer membrane receptor protein involved in Fe transport